MPDNVENGDQGTYKPWYREASTIISIVAFVFSLGTSLVSYIHTRQQDISERRVELRGLIQRLDKIPLDNIEYGKKYSGDPAIIGMINGTLNQENSMLARQAADIAEEIPKSITATEYMGIGSALANSNIYDRALKMYQIGVTISNNADDEVSLRRALASLLFATGSVEKGRQQYRMALDVFSKYDNNNLYHIEYTNTHTEMSWAFSELAIRQCNYASTHIVDSRRHLSQMAAGPFTDQIASQVASAEDNIRKCVP